MKKILTKSENFNQEYCATVVRIGEVTPIEGSDFLWFMQQMRLY